MMKKLAVLLLVLLPSAAAAQPPSPSASAGQPPPPSATAGQEGGGLTLDAAIAQAIEHSHRLAELGARAEAADYAVTGRRVSERPNISAQGGYTRTNHVDVFGFPGPGGTLQVIYPDIPDNFRARLDLQWPIFTGGRADVLTRAAEAERGAIAKDVDAARADLRLEVTRAYWALVTASEAERVLRTSVTSLESHVSDLRARLASGLIAPNDLSSAEAQASHQRMLAIEAETQRHVAEADLRRLTGNETVSLALPAAAAPPEVPPVATAAVADLIARALRGRPERQALEARARSADLRAAAVLTTARPQIAVAGGYDYARPNPRIFPRLDEWRPSWDASINVVWSLWDGGRRAAEHGEARANAAAARTRIDQFDSDVTFEVRARTEELQSSRAAVTAAADEVRAAADAERVVLERYRAGVATNTDVLDAQVARLQAELDRTRAVAAVRLAQARLERAIGQ
jgi:outer membrane protein TolC